MLKLSKKIFYVVTFSLLICPLSFAGEQVGDEVDGEDDPIEKLFKEKSKDYPGCVFIVRDDAEYVDEDERLEIVPKLLDMCIKGRQIGEKRVRKMYEIDPKKDKPSKKSFNIRLVPLDEMSDGKSIPYLN